MIGNTCSPSWLGKQIESTSGSLPHQLPVNSVSDDDVIVQTGNENSVLLLDCRSADEYNECHVTGSLPVAAPSIMLRRLRNGSVPVCTVVGGGETGRTLFTQRWKKDLIVLYDNYGQVASDVTLSSVGSSDISGNVVSVLMSRLKVDGCNVSYLEGGFEQFRQEFNHLCVVGGSHNLPDDLSTTLSLSNLRLSSSAPTTTSFLDGKHLPHHPHDDNSHSDSQCPVSAHTTTLLSPPPPCSKPGVGGLPFPVQVLPYLYLGNAQNSRDLECLRHHNIRYIVNVTDDVANTFSDDPTLTYMRIPITDHWSETLTTFFTNAINFIDEARAKEQAVLVHCLAGISRSVTVTVAYLMYTMSLSMDDAYDFIRRSRPNISPNFNFMGQLKDFELTLQHARQHCMCPSTVSSDSSDKKLLPGLCPHCCRQVKTYFSSPTSITAAAAAVDVDDVTTVTSSTSSPFSMTSSSSAQSLPSPLPASCHINKHQ